MESNKLKILFCTVLGIFLFVDTTFGQTFSEWFSQKKTQKKYLIEQIAALQIYAGYVKKGYSIASQGVNTIKDIKNGEFGLHSTFINGLKTVSPVIRNSSKVVEIINFQLEISKALNSLKSNEWLSATNQSYIRKVKDKVMEDCAEDLEDLLLVITSGKVAMKEVERLERLEKVYNSMRNKAEFTQSFCSQVGLLIRQKENSQRSIDQLKKQYGIAD
ncbi:hypothetical protein ABIB40_003883 [Pedobacter sp. UYP30]|uniref:hypothetical protein n=1 Tax=Pedobacter sp. UYP30 TaxID=1756400 RepID=UPI0033981B7E